MHSCAVIEGGALYCWGLGDNYQLGYGPSEDIGDNETPFDTGPVPLGASALEAAGAYRMTCAIVEGGGAKCWGIGTFGALGCGNTETIGDDELPSDVGLVDIGGEAVTIAANANSVCALRLDGELMCWVWNGNGVLSYGDAQTVGDDETPAERGPVPLWCEAWPQRRSWLV